MSYQFDFDSTHRILRCRFVGQVDDEELKEYYLVSPKYVALTNAAAGITDFSGADSVDVSPKTIRELASLPPVMPEPNQIRCIVAPTDKVFGLARMFELQGEGTRANFHVVRTVKEALAILGLQEHKFEPIETP
jgi:hypothetical protein